MVLRCFMWIIRGEVVTSVIWMKETATGAGRRVQSTEDSGIISIIASQGFDRNILQCTVMTCLSFVRRESASGCFVRSTRTLFFWRHVTSDVDINYFLYILSS